VSVLVVAEPGCSAEGDKATMVRLLETAAQCGAGAWKPQFCSNPVLMCERRHIRHDHPKRGYYERAYSWLRFPVLWHADFRDRCHALGMQYVVSVFLTQDVAAVALFADIIKISSFENGDAGLLRAAVRSGKPVIVSTGMLKRWSWAFWRLKWYQRVHGVRLLQCTSAYPVDLNQLNLKAIGACGLDGLSDHSRDMIVGGLAVANGAEVVEAHYALYDCNPENPDAGVAFSPGEFEIYIKNIRKAEQANGTGDKQPQGQETWAHPYRAAS